MRYLNPGFGGLWDMLGIYFVNVIFITLQKKSFSLDISQGPPNPGFRYLILEN